MKKFQDPSIEVQTFDVQDVITTSNTEGGNIGGGGDVGGGGGVDW